jgi:SAM-dependent methyltransferase
VNGRCAGDASPFVERWTRDVRGGTALDVACGLGRHVRLLLSRGVAVVGVDRDAAALDAIANERAEAVANGQLELVLADLENAPWPLGDRQFNLVVVTNYLWRPLLPRVLDAVAEDGLLLYETFRAGHERFGRPSNPDFLLQPGELLAVVGDAFEVLQFEDGPEGDPPTAMRQRIAARRKKDATLQWRDADAMGRLRASE